MRNPTRLTGRDLILLLLASALLCLMPDSNPQPNVQQNAEVAR